jgi:hypothetical protein
VLRAGSHAPLTTVRVIWAAACAAVKLVVGIRRLHQ